MKKKLLALGALSVAVIALCVSDASAFWFHRCLGCRGCCNRYQSVIVCRPYNAFTPICYGNITCDGCCPSPCCAPAALPSLQPWCGAGYSPCGDPCGAPVMGPAPVFPMPTAPPPVAAPAVTMANQPGVYTASYQPYPYYPTYYQGYYPYPMGYGYMPVNPVPMGYMPAYPMPNYAPVYPGR
ncbi:MAG: hypothetical protein U0793_02615 [Gemmataceae bacterium]